MGCRMLSGTRLLVVRGVKEDRARSEFEFVDE